MVCIKRCGLWEVLGVGTTDPTHTVEIIALAGEGALTAGGLNTATNLSSAFGSGNTASGDRSFASGGLNTVTGTYSAVFGSGNTVDGSRSFASGIANDVAAHYSSAFGSTNTVDGSTSFASGQENSITGNYSAAFGSGNTVEGNRSFASGESNSVTGDSSAAFGKNLTAQAAFSAAFGRYNVISGNSATWVATDPLFVIGNGAAPVGDPPGAASNAFTILKNGNVGVGAADPFVMFMVDDETGSFGIDSTDPLVLIATGKANTPGLAVVSTDAIGISMPAIGNTAIFAHGLDYSAYFQGGDVYVGDSVGIGTTAPVSALDINGGTISLNGGNISNDGGGLGIYIDDSGNVGINDSTPDAALEILREGVAGVTTPVLRVGDDDGWVAEANTKLNGTLSVGGISAFNSRIKAYDGIQLGESGTCDGSLHGTLGVNCASVGPNLCALVMCAPTVTASSGSSWQEIITFANLPGGGGGTTPSLEEELSTVE